MNGLKIITLLTGLIFCFGVFAVDLPGNHDLKQNESGDYYVVNKENITMIEPAIVQLGFSGKWILACIANEAIDSDNIRWVFVDIRNGGTFDSLNKDNWKYFRDEAYPELKNIELVRYRDDKCP